MTEPLTKEEATKVLKKGFGRVLSKVVLGCSVPVLWYRPEEFHANRVSNSGTAFFVDAGSGAFGITAQHVIQGLRDAQADRADYICQVGAARVDVVERLIAEDRERDIATFAISEDELAEMERTPHRPAHFWPPTLKSKFDGKGIFFGGYRGQEKKIVPRHITWGFSFGLGTASNIHDDRLSVQFHREEWIPLTESNLRQPLPNEPWGGVSGAPLFMVIDTGIVSWHLVAVATEFNETFEIIYASSLSQVHADGSMS